jgi:hypothetical protein
MTMTQLQRLKLLRKWQSGPIIVRSFKIKANVVLKKGVFLNSSRSLVYRIH